MEFRKSQLNDIDQIVRIAEDAKAFLKANGVWLTGDDAAYATIHRSAVAPELRGFGLAKRLFDCVCELAAEQGIKSVRVDTHPDNKAMRSALQKAGFFPCGELILERCDEAGDPRIGYERVL